jgi:hypothetical protein
LKKTYTICLAANDVASVFKDFRRSFEEQGMEVISYVDRRPKSKIIERDRYNFWRTKFYPSIFTKYQYSPSWKVTKFIYYRLKNFCYDWSYRTQFNHILKRTDVFIFFYNSFLENSDDLELIKASGKKIIFIFVGDDARWFYGMHQDFKLNNLHTYTYGDDYDYSVKGLEFRLQKIRKAEKFADFIFSKREQSQLQLRTFSHYPMLVYSDEYDSDRMQRKHRPIVVHAPTNPLVKGTKFVLEAFEKLRSEGIEFEAKLIENLCHMEAKQVYLDADIIIDQLYIPGGGKLSTEGMALGKVVLSRMAYNTYEQGFPISECPIVDVSPDTIYNELKRIIVDYPKRVHLAQKGKDYVSLYLDSKKFVKELLDILDGKEPAYQFTPRFFREHYKPESEEACQLLNKWTGLVSDEPWYKQQIESGTSNHLRF